MVFGVDDAIQAANQAITLSVGRSLTDVEIIILKGAWQRLDYDQIAAQNQYSTSYVSNDIAPKLWKALTDALGEKVRKSNFKAALQRFAESHLSNNEMATLLKSGVFRAAPTNAQPTLENSVQSIGTATNSPIDGEGLIPDENYIPRPPVEKNCYATLLQPGSLLRIKAPRQMGKTSLVNHLLCQVAHANYRTVYLSLELTDRRKHLVDLSQFLRWFCLNISRELGIPTDLEDYWDEDGLGVKVSCTTYFEQYLLPQAESPLVLCLDDVDLLFPYPEVYEDFFGLLRSWYEKARSRLIWKKFRLVIVHATDVYIRLNIHQSPFNVGVPVSLPDFTLEQSQSFARACHLSGKVEQVKPLRVWVGGHPYLLKLAFLALANQPEEFLEELLVELPTESGIYGAHLREHLLNLQRELELAIALKQVISADDGVKLKPMLAYKLQSMGLISLTKNMAHPRCRLYRDYFAERLEDIVV